MKATSLLTIVSLCLLAANVRAVEFPSTAADVTSSVGVDIHFIPGWDSDYEAKLDLIQAAGIHAIHTDFAWEAVEPTSTRGVYDTSVYTPFVAACAARDIHIIAKLDYAHRNYGWDETHTTQFATTDPQYYGTQDFRDGFNAYVNHVTQTFSTLCNNYGTTMTWELWNEPNFGFWPGNDPDQYMALASTVLPTIRNNCKKANGDPNAMIIAPAVSSFTGLVDPTEYLRECFTANQNHDSLLNMVDGLSIHFYRGINPETVITDNTTLTYTNLRNLISEYNPDKVNMPILSSEWGYATDPTWGGGITHQRQADYLQRMMLANFSEGVQKVPYSVWYGFIDDNYAEITPENNFGMLKSDLTPKPSYYAMQTLTDNLEGKAFEALSTSTYQYLDGSTPKTATNYISRFNTSSNSRKTYAVWCDGSIGGRGVGNIITSSEFNGGSVTYYATNTPMYLGEVQEKTSGTTWSGAAWSNGGTWVPESQAKFTSAETFWVDTPVSLTGIQYAGTGGDITLNRTGTGKFIFGSGGGVINTGSRGVCINTPIEGGSPSAATSQLTKVGIGALYLGTGYPITFTGNLIIAQGTVVANDVNSLSGPVVTLNSNNGLLFGVPSQSNDRKSYHLGGLAGSGNLSLKDTSNNDLSVLILGESNLSNDADDIGYSGVLGGTGATTSLEKKGTGTILLSNANTYTGTTAVYGGMLAMANNQAFGNTTSAINVYGGGIDIRGCTLSRQLTMGATSITLANTAVNTSSTYTRDLSLRGNITVNAVGTLNLPGAFATDSPGNYTYRTMTKTGSGILNLSGGSDNAFMNLVAAAEPIVGNAVVLGKTSTQNVHAAANVTVEAGATVQYGGSGQYQVWQGGTITLNGGRIDFNGQTQSGTSMSITDAGSTIANTNTNSSGYYANSITASTGFNVNSASILDLSTQIVGSGVLLQKTGTGQLWLTGNTANTGLSIVANAGTVCLNKSGTTAVDGLVAAFSGGQVVYTNSDNQVAQNGQFDLWGGTIDFNGHSQSGTSMNVYTPGSTIANNAPGTLMCYSPTSIAVNGYTHDFTTTSNTFTVNVATNSLLDLSTQITCDTENYTVWPTMLKTAPGTVMLGGGTAANTNLTVDASEGKVIFNKASATYSALAVLVRAGATVQYADGANDQIAPTGGWIQLCGGSLDLRGQNQTGSAFYSQTAGSTLANTAAGTTSLLTPTSLTLNAGLTVNAVGDLTIDGAIFGTGALTKNGAGTLTLTRANTYSGGTTVNRGTLLADFSAIGAPTNNILVSNRDLTLGGGTFRAKFNSSSNTQTVSGTTVASGASAVLADNNAGIVNLNGITRNTGGTVNFTTAQGANIRTSTANCLFTGGRQSILGGYATFGGNTWAVSGTTGGPWNITGLGTYQTTFAATNDVDSPTNPSAIASNVTINSLRFNQSSANSTVSINTSRTLTVATGGILVTPTVGSRTVTIGGNGSLTTGNGQDLIVHQNNIYNTLTISANITGTSRGLTKSGAGRLILSGNKSYTGVTTVNEGELVLSSGTLSGTSSITLNDSGKLLQNSSTALAKSITFSGGTLGGSGTYNNYLGVGDGHLSPGANGVGSLGTFTQTGNLTLASTSVLDFDFGTTTNTCDKWALSGSNRTLVLDGTINITCSGTLLTGTDYMIFSGFTFCTDNGLLFGNAPTYHGYSYRVDNDTHAVYVTAAPEPGTIAILATALLSLAGYAWRKRWQTGN